jgi:hypothetical protein
MMRTQEMGSSRDLVKMNIPLPPGEWEHLKTETVWAEPIGSSLYRIANTPFFAYGLSAEDIVSAEPVEGVLTFAGVSRRGGHSTYRLLLPEGSSYETPEFLKYWKALEDMGCTYESARETWLAVDVPANVDFDECCSALERGHEDGIWSLDEGYRTSGPDAK